VSVTSAAPIVQRKRRQKRSAASEGFAAMSARPSRNQNADTSEGLSRLPVRRSASAAKPCSSLAAVETAKGGTVYAPVRFPQPLPM
jgi:hypothetical protein